MAACWIEVSRRGEIAREELRDRDSDDPTARVRKCFLEMRVGKAIEKITGMCKAHFDGTFAYKDKKKQPNGFKGGVDYVRSMRPYYCVKSYGNRKTSLCTWCLKFEFFWPRRSPSTRKTAVDVVSCRLTSLGCRRTGPRC